MKWFKETWPKVKAWFVEEEPESFSRPLLEQPLPVVEVIQAPETEPAPPPPVSLVYVRERGSGVFVPLAVFPEEFHPEAYGVLAPDTAVLRIELGPEQAAALVFQGSCLRGFVDAEIKALREMRRMDVTEESLSRHLRDR